MQKLPEAPDKKKERHMRKKEPSHQKKETRSLSAMTSRVTTPKSFLPVVEGTVRLSLDDRFANLSTSSSHLLLTTHN